jgi:tripartite-type tricarboxylate transporter receptor subunit TctC
MTWKMNTFGTLEGNRVNAALRSCGIVAVCCLVLVFTPAPASAQAGGASIADAFPVRPVRVVGTNSPGGSPDILIRTIVPKLTEELGKPVIVENRIGGSGIIATEYVSKSPADGYTLLMVDPGPLAINPWIFSKLPYQPLKSFEPVSALVVLPYVLVVRKDLPVTTLQDFIRLAKSNPTAVSYGSSGTASIHHLFMEIFASAAGIRLLHVPYKGGADAVAALLAGTIDSAIISLALSQDLVKSGRLRALGYTRPARSTLMPDLPTIAEQGFPGIDISIALGILAPAGTPRPVINRLNAAFVKVLRDREMTERLTAMGMEVVATTPERYDEINKADYERYRRAAQSANLKMD